MKQTYFLSIQGSYSELEIALYKNTTCIKSIKDKNQKASSLFIPHIQEVLNSSNLKLSDIKFIGVDQGPGAFTSLRVTISTINGLSFANKIPLIGIDGLEALGLETALKFNEQAIENKLRPQILVCLLNAYNNDVYFSMSKIDGSIVSPIKELEKSKGYKKVDLLLEDLKQKHAEQVILFTGNGIKIHKELIKNSFKNNAIFFDQDVCSVNQIAKMAKEKWGKQEDITFKIYPLYLKTQTFAVRPGKSLPCNASNNSKS